MGKLYLVATPIGNLGDITLRAVEILKSADVIAAEDTRKTRGLLTHLGITGKKLVSYYGPREERGAERLLKNLLAGESVAVVTDAGTPGVSDPAGRIVRLAIENGIDIVPVPGASALLSALTASGFDTASFRFEGFLPIKSGKRLALLKELCEEPRTVVLYESTHRIIKLLGELTAEIPDRRIVVGRELTKLYEEFLRGTTAEISAKLTGKRKKGEFVVVLEGKR